MSRQECLLLKLWEQSARKNAGKHSVFSNLDKGVEEDGLFLEWPAMVKLVMLLDYNLVDTWGRDVAFPQLWWRRIEQKIVQNKISAIWSRI